MRPFLHRQLHALEELLESSTAALRAYTALDLNLADTISCFLGKAGAVYRALGLTEGENDMLALQALFAAARSGLHPGSLERVTRNRRDLERATALQALMTSSGRLRAEITRIGESLAETQQRLVPIVTVGIQKGLLPSDPSGEHTQTDVEAMWQSVLRDDDLRLAARPVAMTMSLADIVIVIGGLLETA